MILFDIFSYCAIVSISIILLNGVKIMKKILSNLMLATAFVGFSSFAVAQPPAPVTPPMPQAVKLPPKVTQDFQHGDLSVQFRYLNGKISGLRLMNTGKKNVDVKILKETYVLGGGDYVIINPPNVGHLVIHHQLHSPLNTGASKMLPNRFGKAETYGMPKDMHDTVTSKSQPESK